MKIIKTFENFDQKISQRLYFLEEKVYESSYEEIEKEEYLFPKYPVTFLDSRDISLIQECLPNFEIEIEKYEKSNAVIFANEEETYRIFIEKTEDDYYYVSIFEKVIAYGGIRQKILLFEKNYYKCDQIEELIELLNDKISL